MHVQFKRGGRAVDASVCATSIVCVLAPCLRVVFDVCVVADAEVEEAAADVASSSSSSDSESESEPAMSDDDQLMSALLNHKKFEKEREKELKKHAKEAKKKIKAEAAEDKPATKKPTSPILQRSTSLLPASLKELTDKMQDRKLVEYEIEIWVDASP